MRGQAAEGPAADHQATGDNTGGSHEEPLHCVIPCSMCVRAFSAVVCHIWGKRLNHCTHTATAAAERQQHQHSSSTSSSTRSEEGKVGHAFQLSSQEPEGIELHRQGPSTWHAMAQKHPVDAAQAWNPVHHFLHSRSTSFFYKGGGPPSAVHSRFTSSSSEQHQATPNAATHTEPSLSC
jgi:hypothetical protein